MLLDQLLMLQKSDQEIFQLQSQLEANPKRLARKHHEVEQARQRLSKITDEITRTRMAILENETQLNRLETQLQKLQIHLTQVKNNQDYTLAKSEIEQAQKQKSTLEDKILLAMEKSETLHQDLESQKKTISKLEQELVQLKETIKQEAQTIQGQIELLKARRAEERVAIPQDTMENIEILATYEQLAMKKKPGLVPAVEQEYCGSCRIELRPNQIAQLRLGKIITCNECKTLNYRA